MSNAGERGEREREMREEDRRRERMKDEYTERQSRHNDKKERGRRERDRGDIKIAKSERYGQVVWETEEKRRKGEEREKIETEQKREGVAK
jgi:hypothetical protein